MNRLLDGGLFGEDIFAEFGFSFSGVSVPVTVPLRLLGLDELPTSRDAVRSAFRAKVMEIHPDLAAYTAPGVRDAAEAIALQNVTVQELKWARDVLLARVHEPVTATDGAPGSEVQPLRRSEPRVLVCVDCGAEGPASGRRRPVREYRLRSHRLSGFDELGCWNIIPLCLDCRAEHDRQQARRRDSRWRPDRSCASCEAAFTPSRRDARFCSGACRQKAHRRRNANEPAEAGTPGGEVTLERDAAPDHEAGSGTAATPMRQGVA